MNTELIQQELVRQEFGIDMDVLVDNYSDSPQRVFEVTALIGELSKRLNEKGYKLEVAYDDSLGIPHSIFVVGDKKFPEQGMDAADNFVSICRKLGISSLFEASY